MLKRVGPDFRIIDLINAIRSIVPRRRYLASYHGAGFTCAKTPRTALGASSRRNAKKSMTVDLVHQRRLLFPVLIRVLDYAQGIYSDILYLQRLCHRYGILERLAKNRRQNAAR